MAFMILQLRLRTGDASDAERIRILSASKGPPSSSAKPRSSSGDHSKQKNSTITEGLVVTSCCTPVPEDYAFHNTAFDSTETLHIQKRRNSDPDVQYREMNGSERATCSKNESGLNTGYRAVNSDTAVSFKKSSDFEFMERRYGRIPEQKTPTKLLETLQSRCICNFNCFISFMMSLIPVLNWLPKYKLEFLVPDFIAGFTIAILHIPQGMAYGILASVNPENGLYVSFFPVLVYFVFGTSKHISIGTFAVISIMVSTAVSKIIHTPLSYENRPNVTNNTFHGSSMDEPLPTNLEIVTSLAIAVGFWQLAMGVLRLGALSVVLSDQLVSGFTTGAAFHVATSQLKDLFGITVGNYNGVLKIVYIYIDIFEKLGNSNVPTIIVSAVSIFALAVVKEQINDRFKEKLKMPLPIDLVVVIIATAVSYLANFNAVYKVKIMGDIPTGLSNPVPPRLDLFSQLLADSFAIAIVSFTVSLSMAKLFAKKYKYEINANQELIALGCANAFSSFFACYPCSASLSRSLLQERAGGKTQVAGVVSCCLLLLVLLVIAPLFYSLPKCILSAVILVALKGMFLQVKDFIKAWRISKLDALIWLVTFLATIFLDVSYGLLAGIIFAILSVIIRTMMPSRTCLGNIPGTDIYLDLKRYSEAKKIPGIVIFHFESALYFANRELFKASVIKYASNQTDSNEETIVKDPKDSVQYLIINCSTFSFVDTSGIETLLEIMHECREIGVRVLLAGCSVSMYDLMEGANAFNLMPPQPSVFPTIHDAVENCLRSQLTS